MTDKYVVSVIQFDRHGTKTFVKEKNEVTVNKSNFSQCKISVLQQSPNLKNKKTV